jgi:hypothetical protein
VISEDVLKLSPLLLGLVVFCGCSQRGELVGAASVDQLNVPDQIAVGFNHHQRNRYQSPLSGDWRDGDDIEQMLLRAIELEPKRNSARRPRAISAKRLQKHSSQPSIVE